VIDADEAVTVSTAVTTWALAADTVATKADELEPLLDPDAVVLAEPVVELAAEVSTSKPETTGIVVDLAEAEEEIEPARLAKPTAAGLYL
jgi:hypothetical protein